MSTQPVQPHPGEITYTITHMEGLSGVAAHTLRWYERIGLLDEVARDPGGRRRYTATHLHQLKVVAILRRSGMSVAELADYMRLARQHGCTGPCQKILREQHARLSTEITRLQVTLEELGHLIDEDTPQAM